MPVPSGIARHGEWDLLGRIARARQAAAMALGWLAILLVIVSVAAAALFVLQLLLGCLGHWTSICID